MQRQEKRVRRRDGLVQRQPQLEGEALGLGVERKKIIVIEGGLILTLAGFCC